MYSLLFIWSLKRSLLRAVYPVPMNLAPDFQQNVSSKISWSLSGHLDRLADFCKHLSINRMTAGSRPQVQVMDFFFFHLLFKHTLCSQVKGFKLHGLLVYRLCLPNLSYLNHVSSMVFIKMQSSSDRSLSSNSSISLRFANFALFTRMLPLCCSFPDSCTNWKQILRLKAGGWHLPG